VWRGERKLRAVKLIIGHSTWTVLTIMGQGALPARLDAGDTGHGRRLVGQLFVEGPTSDDNITSKAGRCDLVSAGLAFHEAGLSSLTPDGVRMAREWDLCSLYARRDRRWYLKVRFPCVHAAANTPV
jgi:hypothetical protein